MWRFANAPGGDARASEHAALAFALSAYSFRRYRKPSPVKTKLAIPEGVDGKRLSRMVDAITLARDLVNTPANDMGPDALEAAARALAERHRRRAISVIAATSCWRRTFRSIHAVGRAAARAPRLVDISWGRDDAAAR